MNALYDPRVSAACLALREAPPRALDDAVLRYAQEAFAAAELRRTEPPRWWRRAFAMTVAFIMVASAAGWWQRASMTVPEQASAPPQAVSAPQAIEVAPPARVIVERERPATRPLVKEVPRKPVARKPKVKTPVVSEPPVAQRVTIAPPTRPAPAVDGVEVRTIPSVESLDAEPASLAPPTPTPAIEPAADPCVADPLSPECVPPGTSPAPGHPPR